MPKQSKKTNRSISVAPKLLGILRFVFLFLTLTGLFTYTRVINTNTPVHAATSSTLNFQARLTSSTGGVVPDGNYHIEFKLYNVSSGGTALWTETRTTGNQVAVKNGYLSVNLGSVTTLPTINWDQDLWLTMNIGGAAGSAAWDGEMTPRVKLTAVPYAFQSGAAAKLNQNQGTYSGLVEFGTLTADRKYLFPDTSLATTASPGTICVYNGAASNCPAASGSAYYIQNDTVLQTQSNFNLQARDSGVNGTVAAQLRGASAGQTVDLLQFRDSAGTLLSAVDAVGSFRSPILGSITTGKAVLRTNYDTGGLVVDTNGAANKGLVVRGSATQTADLFQIQNSSSTPLLIVNADGNVGIGAATAAYDLTLGGTNPVIGAENGSASLSIVGSNNNGFGGDIKLSGGNIIGLDPGSGGFVYIYGGNGDTYGDVILAHNGTSALGKVGIGTSGPSAILHVASNSANEALFRVTDTTATARDVLNIADGGATTFRNQTDSTAAFQVQNAAGASLVTTSTVTSAAVLHINSTASSSQKAIIVNNSTSTGNILEIQDNGTPVFTIADGGNVAMTGNLDTDGLLNVGTGNAFSVSGAGQLTFVGVATDITTGSNEDLTVVAAGTGQIILNDIVQVATLGTASNDTVVCRNGTNQLATCNSSFITSTQLQNYVQFAPVSAQSDTSANPSLYINDSGGGNLLHLQSGGADKFVVDNSGNTNLGGNITFAQGANRTISIVQVTSGAGNNMTIAAGQGAASNGAGGVLALAGGAGGGTNQNGGNLTLNGGAATGTGSRGHIILQGTSGNVGIGVASPSQQLEISGNFRLPTTTATAGIIYSGSNTLLHSFSTNSTFVGVNSGNLTTTGNNNTGVGTGALQSLTDGSHNTAVGQGALTLNTGGYQNVAVGSFALDANTTGIRNVAVGYNSLTANTIGEFNTAAGYGSLQANTTGSSNSAYGAFSLSANSTGLNNTAFGYAALEGNLAGNSNVAIGPQSLKVNDGDNNIAVGYNTLLVNSGGDANVAIGTYALQANISGSNNTAIGLSALQNSTGDNNLAIGSSALYSNIGGSNNIAFGSSALSGNTSGSGNTVLGVQAGYNNNSNANTTGNNNTFIGFQSGPGTTSQLTNATALGFNAKVSTSNSIVLGGTGADAVNVGIGTTSPSSLLSIGGGTGVLTVDANGNLGTSGTITVTNATTDITTGTNQDLTVVANGTGQINLNDTVRIGAALGAATANAEAICRDSSLGVLTYCDANTSGRPLLDGGNTFSQTVDIGTNDAFDVNIRTGGSTKLTVTSSGSLTFAQGADRIISIAQANSSTGNKLTLVAGQGGASNGQGGVLELIGGPGAGTNQNGGNITIDGGTATGTGSKGNVILQGSGGNVGIGIAPTTHKLEVAGDIKLSDGTARTILGPSAQELNINSQGSQILDLNDSVGGNVRLFTGQNSSRELIIADGANASEDYLSLSHSGSFGLIQTSSVSDFLLLQQTGGKVGIGNFVPTAQFEVLGVSGVSGATGTAGTAGLIVNSGNGGNSTNAATAGGAGGGITLVAGNGGNSTGVAGTNGANITLQGGTGGTGTTTGNYGNILLNATGGNVGIGTSTPQTRLQVGAKVSDDNSYVYDTNTTSLIHQTGTGTAVLNDPKTVLLLGRQGTAGQAYGAAATFNISRYENSTTNSRTRLDISLAHNAFDATSNNIMTLLSSGNVGIGDTTPAGLFTVGNGDLFQVNSSGDITTAAGENLSINTGTTGTLTIDTGTTGNISIGTNANAKTITLGNTQTATVATINAGAYNLSIRNTGIGINAASPTTGTVDLFFGSGARTININQSAASTAGGNLTIAAGMSGTGAVNGGNLVLQGGASGGSGAQGLVTLSTTSFTAAAVQTFASAGTFPITAGNIDLYSTLPITASVAGVIVTIPDPVQNVTGRIVYIAARSGSNDFTLRLNSSRTAIDIAMKANSTATLIWNGTDWTAAGASSSTDLQSAYNNTLTSAGGAELVLNTAGGAADGLTIRNNATTPISGGILEVQTSIGTNLFSVNNFGTELASNGGAETSATFATNWTSAPAGGTITRTTTAGQFVTGLAGAQVVTTTTANTGIRNNLSGNPINTIGAKYQVSFAAKSSLSGTAIDVQYSHDGGTTLTACTDYGAAGAQNLSNTVWTKITCTITINSTAAVTNPDLIIRKTDGTTAPTLYIDNLSFMRNDSTTQPSNVQIGGGISGGQVTLFTLDRSTAPPVANGDTTYYGSMYYDTTTGSIQCYEADGWGACGSPPDNIITLTPEYTGAVLNGTGVGTLTADFCANSAALTVGTLCATNDARNFYRWTSPQATDQTYSIYVTYKLPSTFKEFANQNTIKLTTRTTSTSLASANMQVLRKTTGGITSCGTHTGLNLNADVWEQTTYSGNEYTCGFVGGDYVVFKIDVTARSSASIFIENLDFTYTNR